MTNIIKKRKETIVTILIIGTIILLIGKTELVTGALGDPPKVRKGDFITMKAKEPEELPWWMRWIQFDPLYEQHMVMYYDVDSDGRHWFLESGPVCVHYIWEEFLEFIWKDFRYFYAVNASEDDRINAFYYSEGMKPRLYQHWGQFTYAHWNPEDTVPENVDPPNPKHKRWQIQRWAVPRFYCTELVWAGYMGATDTIINIAYESEPADYGSSSYTMVGYYQLICEANPEVDEFFPDDPPLGNNQQNQGIANGNLAMDDPTNNTWTTIQKGVDNLSSSGVLYVKNGTYSENIVVNKSITIIGENADNVTIYGSVATILSHDYELPDNGETDLISNVNMTGNEVLLKFNNDSSLGENYSVSNVVYDYSEYGNNGTNNNATWTTTALKGNGSMDFNGINNSVNLSNILALTGENVTISAWIHWNGGSGTADPIVSQSNATHGYCLYVNSTTEKPVFRLDTNVVVASVNISNGWHHIVGTHNETTLKIFIDGEFRGSSSKTGSGIDRDAYVGYDNISSYFNGMIDEVAIWNRTLSDDELSYMYWLNYGPTLENFTLKNGEVGMTLCNNTHLYSCNIVNYTIGIQIGNVSGLWISCNISECDIGIKINNSNPVENRSNFIGPCYIAGCSNGIVVNSSSNINIILSYYNCSNTNLTFNNCNNSRIQVSGCTTKDNVGPDTPSLSGPTLGEPGTSYTYYSVTNESDGEQLFYQFYWDDDNFTEVLGPYMSNETVNASHTWEKHGGYYIFVIAKDVFYNESWSEPILFRTETLPPLINSVNHTPDLGGYGMNITITANVTDDQSGNYSGIQIVRVNITYPDNSKGNYTMNDIGNNTYEYNFSGTWLIGQYNYTIWAVDNAYNTNSSTGHSFIVNHLFGFTTPGGLNQSVEDRITGSVFTVNANGTADNITAYIQTNLTFPAKTECMIYRNNDSTLIGTTDELTLDTGLDPDWVVFNFSGTKPTLVKDTEYVLSCWSNDTCYLYYTNCTDMLGRYNGSLLYGGAPDPVNWSGNESRMYSIYCSYTTNPEITNVSANPDTVGFGFNITVSANVDDYGCGIDIVKINVTYPQESTGNFTMNHTENNTYEYVFSDTWLVGQYNYSIWACDGFGSCNTSTSHSFNVSAQATISVCTMKDEYGNNETINLTDPPGDPPLIGYELLDDGDVLHIWNKYDSYYFNTSSGIQLTNHYDEYWSHNVLMMGYYDNDEWNLIYRADELSGFNKDIDTDNETYVNATLWKDLTYQGYDFRLAIRYQLGVDDNELTVIPYIKNLDEDDISYTLGFGWEMKDIQIDMTSTGDYIDVNRTIYFLNQTLDNTYIDLLEPEFYLMKNITDTSTKSLYLRWNQSLTYKLQVKSRDGQYNAPVTLFVRIGTLNAGQEKYTEMYWYDADQVTYYFNSYDNNEAWATIPGNMVDGSTSNYASTSIDGDVELCDGNNCSGNDLGTISKVELRVSAFYTGGPRDIILRPVFGGTTDGIDYRYQTPSETGPIWSPWFDITNDPFAPQSWSWTDVLNLDCDVEAGSGMLGFTLYCSKVKMRVTYTPNNPPGISNPYPADGSTSVSIFPVLNITVSDADGDSMNIIWFSNSSGSWQVFGTNNSVCNGTYHQTFSNVTENGKWWYWMVNVTDGTKYTESSVYRFYTGNQSKINNTCSTNISGYLLIQVQYYNTSNSTWVVADDTVNETTPRTINASEQLGLDTIFNGLVNTSNLSSYGSGTYRIYAAFRDPEGNVLVCDDETELVATYEFTITFE